MYQYINALELCRYLTSCITCNIYSTIRINVSIYMYYHIKQYVNVLSMKFFVGKY